MSSFQFPWVTIVVLGWTAAVFGADATAVRVEVLAERAVYRYQPANNGAGPMWCAGSTCLVRAGKQLYASGLETIPDVQPLNNCRWTIWHWTGGAWQRYYTDRSGRTREPSPLAIFPDARFFVSANPTRADPRAYSGPARPEIYEFITSNGSTNAAPHRTTPRWSGTPPFTEHSYRSFVADGARRELLLIQNIGYTHAVWAFRDAAGSWAASGKLIWPFGSDYERPQPIRVCYPTVMLKDRAVYFCGVSDIMEPNSAWREFKKKLTGRDWDYDFRRLFYTWCDDIAGGKFHSWVEVASREKTAGHIFPCDLWVDADRNVHLLWTERALDERLREKFFPHARQSHALNYAILRDGKVVTRRALVVSGAGRSNLVASAARFHVAPGNHLFVVYYVRGMSAEGSVVDENRLLPIAADGTPGASITIPLQYPLSSFFTASVRAGNRPSEFLDLLGTRSRGKHAICHATVRIQP